MCENYTYENLDQHDNNCIDKVSKINRKLTYKRVCSGVVLPYRKSNQHSSWGIGGVVDSENTFVMESHYKNGWAEFGGEYSFDLNNIKVLDEEVIYMGFFVNHWGHFLLDLVNRLWYIVNNYNNQRIVYISENKEIEGNYLRFFELLGIKRDKLLRVENPTKFSAIIIPELSYIKTSYYSNEYLEMFEHVAQAVVKDSDIKKWANRKVYFSRSKYAKGIRAKEFGENRIERILQSNGYVCVQPEDLSLDEQICIWNFSEKLICINGSIPLNLLFCNNEKVEVMVFNKTCRVHENLFLVEKMKKIKVKYVDVYDRKLADERFSLGMGPFIMTITPPFFEFCKDNHLIGVKRPRRSNLIDVTRYKIMSLYRRLKN